VCGANNIFKDLSKLGSSAERWRWSLWSFKLSSLLIPVSYTSSCCHLTVSDGKDQSAVGASIDEAEKIELFRWTCKKLI